MYRTLYLIFCLFVYQFYKAQDPIVENKLSDSADKYIYEPPFTTSINYSKIVALKRKYYYTDGKTIKISEPLGMYRILAIANNLSLKKDISSLALSVCMTERNIKRQKKLGIAGIPCLAFGLGIQFVALVSSTGNGPNGNDKFAAAVSSVGAAVFLLGLSFETISIINGFKKKKHLNEVINIYNQNL